MFFTFRVKAVCTRVDGKERVDFPSAPPRVMIVEAGSIDEARAILLDAAERAARAADDEEP